MKKKEILTRGEFKMLKGMMTIQALFDNFYVSNKLVTRMLAEDAMVYVAFTDVSPKYITEQKAKLN